MPETSYIAVPLSGKSGRRTLVDAEDARVHCQRKIYLAPKGYAMWRGAGGTRYLHREIMGLTKGDGLQVDHINGDKLDNRRVNLRVCTNRDNLQNMKLSAASTSGYRGVTRHRDGRRWDAQATLEYKHYGLGTFDDIQDAARAAADFRAEHMPFSADARSRSVENPDEIFNKASTNRPHTVG